MSSISLKDYNNNFMVLLPPSPSLAFKIEFSLEDMQVITNHQLFFFCFWVCKLIQDARSSNAHSFDVVVHRNYSQKFTDEWIIYDESFFEFMGNSFRMLSFNHSSEVNTQVQV